MSMCPACEDHSAKTSASVPMFTHAGGPTLCVVEIRIYVDEPAPPAGRVRRVGAGEPVPFSGWLDLIRSLEPDDRRTRRGPASGREDR